MGFQHEKLLLVEGPDDKAVISALVKRYGIECGDRNENQTVTIKTLEGLGKLKEKVSVEFKDSSVKTIGIVLDADKNPDNRWQSIRNCLTERYQNLPKSLPQDGLIHPGDKKVGVWIMPNNQEAGMLETFLQFSLPDGNEKLWAFTEQCCKQAKEQGAPFRECHADKAKIHTWLAWQDPPGKQLYTAVTKRIFDSTSPQARIFMQWFQKLFEVATTGKAGEPTS
ncbi:MAG: hypothetical protein D3903_10275 [Candidatus Electrothrix sp. GM3_4]|nr:hypothetical protein [Candidatus Electrothrix sp. GM3_4]